MADDRDAYLFDRAAGEAAFLREQDGGSAYVPCNRCGGSGMFADEYEGLPDCYAPCPYCRDARAAVEASLATIAPAFKGVL